LRHGTPGGPTSFDTRLALQSDGRTGEWQTLEIQAIGDAIHVTLNDNYMGTGSAGGNARGYIGLQGGIAARTQESSTSPDRMPAFSPAEPVATSTTPRNPQLCRGAAGTS
jgi:hypothetical protein